MGLYWAWVYGLGSCSGQFMGLCVGFQLGPVALIHYLLHWVCMFLHALPLFVDLFCEFRACISGFLWAVLCLY